MNENRSTSIDEAKAIFRQNPEYQKAERLVSPFYELAAKIINLRVKLGLTQKELAEKAETYQSRVSKIESGEHDIRLSTLTKIAEALHGHLVIDIIPIMAPDLLPYQALFSHAHAVMVIDDKPIQFLEDDTAGSSYSYEVTIA